MRFIDRSRIEADWRCPRKRFHNYEFGGRGLQPARRNFDFEFGTVVHEEIENAILGRAVNAAARLELFVKQQGGDEDQQKQWGAIAQGLVEGFMRVVWPKLQEEYELVSVEREASLQLAPDMLFQARPDLLLRNKATGALWYFELKTTGWIDPDWLKSWQKAPQVQLGALACEAELGESLAGCIVIGLYKGRKGKEGRQDSVFAHGWKTGDLPGILKTQYSYEYMRGKGWERFSTTEFEGGVSAWVQNMPEELLQRQFVTSDPIFLRRDMADALVKQTVIREFAIAAAMNEMQEAGDHTEVLDRVFRQHFNQCEPAFGSKCEFLDACWIPWIGRDPLSSGQFVEREPHHEAERKWFELKEVA